jgi:hypothetical protein
MGLERGGVGIKAFRGTRRRIDGWLNVALPGIVYKWEDGVLVTDSQGDACQIGEVLQLRVVAGELPGVYVDGRRVALSFDRVRPEPRKATLLSVPGMGLHYGVRGQGRVKWVVVAYNATHGMVLAASRGGTILNPQLPIAMGDNTLSACELLRLAGFELEGA